MYTKIIKCDYKFDSPWWDPVSLNAKDLVDRLLQVDPKKRLTAKQALNHPWVKGTACNGSHMEETQTKLKEFNAQRKLKVLMDHCSCT